MRVLWLCNVIIPGICKRLNIPETTAGGWLEETFEELIENDDNKFAYCAPCEGNGIIRIEYRNAFFFGYQRSYKPNHKYDLRVESDLKKILDEFQPDIVHIFGTEFPHALAMTRAFNRPEKTVIHIQGFAFLVGEHYRAFLPSSVYYRMTLRDVLRVDNIALQKRKFDMRGDMEINAIKNVCNVMGRTEFDHAIVQLINDRINYYYCPENMRKAFLDNDKKWDLLKCERHSIFISQGDYPIKGLHNALKALSVIVHKYPDAKLYVAGANCFNTQTIWDKIKKSSYERYIVELIQRNHLEKHVIFTGRLSADKMLEMYLNSNVYILPSTIENSPNSLQEAMIVGMPVVAANVGGVSDFLRHRESGFLYPTEEWRMLAHYVINIFDDEKMSIELGDNAYREARNRLNIKTNIQLLQSIYEKINLGEMAED